MSLSQSWGNDLCAIREIITAKIILVQIDIGGMATPFLVLADNCSLELVSTKHR